LSTSLLLLLAAGSLARSTTAGDELFNDEEEDVFNNLDDFDDLTDINYGEDNPDFDTDRTLTGVQDRLGYNEHTNFKGTYYATIFSGMDPDHKYWIGGIIPFKIGESVKNYSQKLVKDIEYTLRYLMKYVKCLKFRRIENMDEAFQPVKSSLFFNISTKADDPHWNQCHTHPGKHRGNPYGSVVNLGSGSCRGRSKTLMHEILHGLGFKHTMVRPDRDDNIVMNWENLSDQSMKSQYMTLTEQWNEMADKRGMEHIPEMGVTHDMPYECHSIMHYKPNKNSRGGPVFSAKAKNCNFYSNDFAYPQFSMTANDMKAVNMIYCPADRKHINWKGEKQWSYTNWWNPPKGKTCRRKPKDISSLCAEMRAGCFQSNWYREMQYYCPGYCIKAVKELVCKDPEKYGLNKKHVKLCKKEQC